MSAAPGGSVAGSGGVLNARNLGLALAVGAVSNHVRMQRKLTASEKALARSSKLVAEDVIVVGAGISGICMGIKLKKAGIPFTILEKEEGFGGTWFLNRYPGCACDIPAHLYSFSFEPKTDWSAPYAPQAEIYRYLDGVARKYHLERNTVFGCGLASSEWDEATRRWHVTTTTGATYNPRFVINAVGGLHHPSYPDAPGMDEFEGESFHSTHWKEGIDLTGKRVVVVGSAASAVQLVPHVAKQAKEVVILQRTPNWVSSRFHPLLPRSEYSSASKWWYSNIPLAEKLHRLSLYLAFEATFWPLGVFDKDGLGQSVAQRLIRYEMCKRLGNNEELIDKVVPKYGIGCKRICRTDDYLEALCRDNVKLIPQGLRSVGSNYVEAADGTRAEADVVIYATGFQVGSIGKDVVLTGRNGTRMTGTTAADDAVEMYLGVACRDFPNSFMIVGSNSGLGHNSIILLIESQTDYIIRMLTEAIDNDIQVFEIQQTVVDEYYKWLWKEFDQRVWKHGGCNSWYQNKDGKIFSLWPATTVEFFRTVDNAPSLRDSYMYSTGAGENASGAHAARL